jgi:histidinol phosphatase-like enzyme
MTVFIETLNLQLIPYSNQDLVQIERATQHYCFVLHQKRTEILKNIM